MHCLLILAEAQQQLGLEQQMTHILRLPDEQCLTVRQRFFLMSKSRQRAGAVDTGIDRIGVKIQSAAIAFHRLLMAATGGMSLAREVECLSAFRIQLLGGLVCGKRPLPVPANLKDSAHEHAGLGACGMGFTGMAGGHLRISCVTGLQLGEGQQAQHFEPAGLDLNQTAIKLYGFIITALPMQCGGLAEKRTRVLRHGYGLLHRGDNRGGMMIDGWMAAPLLSKPEDAAKPALPGKLRSLWLRRAQVQHATPAPARME